MWRSGQNRSLPRESEWNGPGLMKGRMRSFDTDRVGVNSMASDEIVGESTVSDRYGVTIPARIRSRLDVRPGDKVRWRLMDDRSLHVEVIRQRYGAFDDFEPINLGTTNAAEDHDEILADEIDEDQ